MLLHAFVPASRANGPGLRAVVYFQGCSLQCPGCWNPSSHKFRGIEVTVPEVAQRFEEARRLEPLEGATFSGGEPMQQAEGLLELMREIRKTAPAASLGMFTGYTESELASGRFVTRLGPDVEQKCELWRTVRELLDFAVMGRYDQTQPSIAPLRTSEIKGSYCLAAATKRATSDRNSSKSASRKVGNPYSRDSPCSAFLPETKPRKRADQARESRTAPRRTSRHTSNWGVDACLSRSGPDVDSGSGDQENEKGETQHGSYANAFD